MKNTQKIIYRFFYKQKIHSGVIFSEIYSRIFTRIDSLFKAGACTFRFLSFWLTYTNDCRANAILRPLLGARWFNERQWQKGWRGMEIEEIKLSWNGNVREEELRFNDQLRSFERRFDEDKRCRWWVKDGKKKGSMSEWCACSVFSATYIHTYIWYKSSIGTRYFFQVRK